MQLSKGEIEIVIEAIRRYLPADVEIFFFGSRVDGSSHRGSDLDVLLKGEAAIALSLIALVKEGLDESDLPFRVDLLDYHRCSERMLKNISSSLEGPLKK